MFLRNIVLGNMEMLYFLGISKIEIYVKLWGVY